VTERAAHLDAFDEATAVASIGDGTYRAQLDESFSILGKPNGGYLLAVAARAVTTELVERGTNHPHCVAASASFIRAPRCGPADIRVTVHRSGTKISQVHAAIIQDGRVAVDAILSCGRLDASSEPRYAEPCSVVLPDLEHCPRVAPGGPPGEGVTIMDRVELHLDPATTGFSRGELAAEAEVRGWLRLAGGRPFDPLSLLFASDALPPATLPIGSSGWVPTIQLSVYVRGMPAEGWLVARQRATLVAGSLVDEVCELWDATGRPVVQAVQLAMVRFPS